LAKPLFGVAVPVTAVEFKENGGVGETRIGLEDQNPENLGGFIELGDDSLMRECEDRPLT
jgi:hypothetical protein